MITRKCYFYTLVNVITSKSIWIETIAFIAAASVRSNTVVTILYTLVRSSSTLIKVYKLKEPCMGNWNDTVRVLLTLKKHTFTPSAISIELIANSAATEVRTDGIVAYLSTHIIFPRCTLINV